MNNYSLYKLIRSLSYITFLLIASATAQDMANNSLIKVSNFSSGILEPWITKVFEGKTDYRIVQRKNRNILQAHSNGTASGLYREIRIHLDKTPYLNWSWRIETSLGKLNEQSKNGDDYAARIYVIASGGLAFWRTKALNYVWSSNSPKHSSWPNAFAGNNTIMVAARSQQDCKSTWYTEKRHIKSDLKKYFDNDIRYIDAVAIMTDTDNSGKQASAYYGEIYFSAK